MRISVKDLILGVTITLVGAATMTAGISFSETVNPVSVLGILVGTQILLVGQWKVFQSIRKMRLQAAAIIRESTE